jgi:hypothetical protein
MLAPFVDARWLSERFDEVVVCDVRWYVDGRSPEVFAEGDGALGIGDSDTGSWSQWSRDQARLLKTGA